MSYSICIGTIGSGLWRSADIDAMCGIAGILLASPNADPRRLAVVGPMTETLHHRGPDGGGVWAEGMDEREVDWVANEGVRLSRILKFVKEQALGGDTQRRIRDGLFSASPPQTAPPTVARKNPEEVADAVVFLLLLEPEPAAKHGIVSQFGFGAGVLRAQFVRETGVLEKLASGVPVLVVDQDAARQDAERAFKHAHVPVEHHMRDLGALEQRFDRGDQDRVIGTHQFVQRFAP